ncbi:hypothetical protein [Agromyces bauzanensis]|uniref:DUF2127 domain-containing protein n=1 Tax=Agromyces bauzanensis TaxID=1308924 RepID=A0A917UX80_9MICO|nr:hypothetical protein [Agromyces bauzanensis]GGJ92318.1 hypothetical protein GCM10011372_33520 [Agromyces bauzanensis]
MSAADPERRHVSVEKRPAFESPAVLATPVTPPVSMPRPAATAFGALLVCGRVAAGIAGLVALGLAWDDIVRTELEIELEGRDSQAASDLVLTVVIVAGGVVLAVELLLALFIWRGSNRARVTVMSFSTISIVVAWIDSVTGSTEITLRTTFVTLALDILVLLALSSRNARAYARRPRQRSILHRRWAGDPALRRRHRPRTSHAE